MMYVAQKDGRISNPVVLEINLSVADLSGTKFSDRNATKNGAIIANGYDGAKNIHFSSVKQSTHFDLPDNEKDFYQAEILVLEAVPLSYITNIDSFRPNPQTMATYPSYTGTRRSSGTSPTSSSSQSEGNGCLWVIAIGIIIMIIVAISG